MTRKILWVFSIQMDYPILARISDLIFANEKITYDLVGFAVPGDHRVKVKEIELIDKYLDFAKRAEDTVKHEVDGDNNCSWIPWNSSQRFGKEIGGTGDQRKNHC